MSIKKYSPDGQIQILTDEEFQAHISAQELARKAAFKKSMELLGYLTPQETASVEIGFEISKLKLRRVIRQIGLEAQFDAFLNLDPIIKAEYEDSTVLRSDDARFLEAFQAFASLNGKTEEELKQILKEAKAF